jgi:hypothetical protein
MPYNKLELAAMTATSDELLDIEGIAKRLEVDNRTVERLIEKYAKKLKKSRWRRGRKIMYQWADILRCAKLHTGIEKEDAPSVAIMRAFTKQRVKELEAEVERLNNVNGVQRQRVNGQTVMAPLE